jgi:hypothetical protein
MEAFAMRSKDGQVPVVGLRAALAEEINGFFTEEE